MNTQTPDEDNFLPTPLPPAPQPATPGALMLKEQFLTISEAGLNRILHDDLVRAMRTGTRGFAN